MLPADDTGAVLLVVFVCASRHRCHLLNGKLVKIDNLDTRSEGFQCRILCARQEISQIHSNRTAYIEAPDSEGALLL